MLDEKTMVSDALAGVNGELVRYGEMIFAGISTH